MLHLWKACCYILVELFIVFLLGTFLNSQICFKVNAQYYEHDDLRPLELYNQAVSGCGVVAF
jgi:hypothetical protein